MNIIKKAVINGRHKTDHLQWVKHTWKDFQREAGYKKVFVFGGTAACDYFIKKYGKKYSVISILDNDSKKWGQKYENYTVLTLEEQYQELIVESPDILSRFRGEEITILIASTNYYEEIAQQLEQLGMYDYYILCIMEAARFQVKIDVFIYQYILKRILPKRWEVYTDYLKRRMLFYKNVRHPIQNNKILFLAFGKYCDHTKYITEKLIKLNKELDIVWVLHDKTEKVPDAVRKISKRNSKAMVYEMCTSRIWVCNEVFPRGSRKRKGQYYIHTKHWSSVTLKRFYLDAPTIGKLSSNVRYWKHEGRMMDYIITGSRFDTESCMRGFRPKGECVELGSPRSDILFEDSSIYNRLVKEQYGIPGDAKLLLYAPTYRFQKDSKENIQILPDYLLDYQQLFRALVQKFSGEWYILLRLHPSLEKYAPLIALEERVINVSSHSDVQELVAAAEIMISDYSSIMFEPCYVKKPVFLYATDIKEYTTREYDLLIDIHELPFPVAEDNEQLSRHIKEFDKKEYDIKVEQFLNRYGVHEDGQASLRAARFIEGLINGR